MSLILDENQAEYQIRSYKPGMIQVNETIFTQSIIISPHKLLENWPPQRLSELIPEHLNLVIPFEPTLLLLGTGTNMQFPPIELYGHLINKGIGIEIMDTHAACRTYNALTAENRNVAAALIIK